MKSGLKEKHKKFVLKYFRDKAKDYDLVENQIYWKFSDQLLWLSMVKYLDKLPNNFSFIDAGGGTGRWSFKILKKYPNSKGVIYDFSDEMLSQARQKTEKNLLGNRISFIKADLENVNVFNRPRADVSFNLHNVLGFTNSPVKALKNIVKMTRSDGFVISFVPNLYHLIYFNVALGNIDDAYSALSIKKGKFTNAMPQINLFTPQSISKLYENLGLRIEGLTGFPVSLYPGYLETQIQGSSKSLSNILERKSSFNKLVKLETELIKNKDIAARGNNIFIVGKKYK